MSTPLITQTITLLPAAPDPATDDAPTFSTKAAAMVLGQKAMVPEMNTYAGQANALAAGVDAAAAAADADAATASAAASTAVNAPGSGATSTTSLTVGTGSKTLTIQTGKLFGVGQFVTIANGANVMTGSITAYNSGTGSLTVDVTNIKGSGTFASWTIGLAGAPGLPSLVMVASVTPAAAATADFLTLFSNNTIFDDFVVILEGISNSGSGTGLRMRYANGGTVDATSNYIPLPNNSDPTTTTATSSGASGNVGTLGKGATGQINIFNVNSSTGLKGDTYAVIAQADASTFNRVTAGNAYNGGVISGFRLFWNDGSNFKAQGTVRVYGISKN